MATYAFVHGGGGSGAEFDLLAAELRGLGHDVVAPDLPIEDSDADLAAYAQTVVDAIGDRTGVIVVAHSLGAFTAPIVCEWTPVDLLVLLAATVPAPGESFSDWWANTGYEEAARRYLDPDAGTVATFMHDVPPDLVAAALARERKESGATFGEPWPLEAWPDVPTRFLLFRDDRMFPAPWLRQVAQQRLGITPDEMDGSHAAYLSRPKELVQRLEAYRTGLGRA
jgi:pimeloyl-ACP methyl ester carboxylesterase